MSEQVVVKDWWLSTIEECETRRNRKYNKCNKKVKQWKNLQIDKRMW